MAGNKAVKLTGWNDADAALMRIGEIDREQARREADMNDVIATMKREAEEELRPILEERKRLEKALQVWCKGNRKDFGDQKMKHLTFGTVSFRSVAKLTIHNIGNTLRAIKATFPKRVAELVTSKLTETLDKDALKRMKPEELGMIGCTLTYKDEFSAEPDQDKIPG